jgi:hypothetical protein
METIQVVLDSKLRELSVAMRTQFPALITQEGS